MTRTQRIYLRQFSKKSLNNDIQKLEKVKIYRGLSINLQAPLIILKTAKFLRFK